MSWERWRCFHCDECFITVDSAMEHFGRTERQSPACQIDIAEYRAMEQRMLAYNQEDAEIHRELNARLSDHQLALVREEERGYARGLRDAVPGAAVWALPEEWLKDAAADERTPVADTLTQCAMALRKALETRPDTGKKA